MIPAQFLWRLIVGFTVTSDLDEEDATELGGYAMVMAHFERELRAPSEFHDDSRDDLLRLLFSQLADVDAHIPSFPLRVQERHRIFPPSWESEALDDEKLAFMFGDA
jgi:hypothetical protein